MLWVYEVLVGMGFGPVPNAPAIPVCLGSTVMARTTYATALTRTECAAPTQTVRTLALEAVVQ